MKEHCKIEYLSQDDINFTNNALYYATESKLFKELGDMHGIELESDITLVM